MLGIASGRDLGKHGYSMLGFKVRFPSVQTWVGAGQRIAVRGWKKAPESQKPDSS